MDSRREQLRLGVALVHRQLVPHPVVVAANAEHEHEEDRHRRDRVTGAMDELGGEHDEQDGARHGRADAVDDAGAAHPTACGRVLLDGEQSVPVSDHAELAQGEGHEDADDVELDELGDLGVVEDDQAGSRGRQDDDAVGEGEPVAAGVQLTRQVTVLGENRAEDRKAVEGGVRREEEDQAGHDGDQDDAGRETVEDGLGDLTHDGVLDVGITDRSAIAQQLGGRVLREVHVGEPGQDDHREQHGHGNGAHEQQGRGRVAALGLLEGGHAVRDRLDAGECRTP